MDDDKIEDLFVNKTVLATHMGNHLLPPMALCQTYKKVKKVKNVSKLGATQQASVVDQYSQFDSQFTTNSITVDENKEPNNVPCSGTTIETNKSPKLTDERKCIVIKRFTHMVRMGIYNKAKMLRPDKFT